MHLAYEERKHLRDDNKEEDEEESEENMKSENNDYPSSQPSPREEVAKQNRLHGVLMCIQCRDESTVVKRSAVGGRIRCLKPAKPAKLYHGNTQSMQQLFSSFLLVISKTARSKVLSLSLCAVNEFMEGFTPRFSVNKLKFKRSSCIPSYDKYSMIFTKVSPCHSMEAHFTWLARMLMESYEAQEISTDAPDEDNFTEDKT
ncbi:uncharacterized protein [Montipora foliosa]|uniref:uncharacterized protein n=1 Tax=Montipora foliosa TaxID=591990 RepID=UPI0035F15D3F